MSAKPVSTLLDPNHNLAKATIPPDDMSEHYRYLIGKLTYLTITCPKLNYIFHILAQFMQPLENYSSRGSISQKGVLVKVFCLELMLL